MVAITNCSPYCFIIIPNQWYRGVRIRLIRLMSHDCVDHQPTTGHLRGFVASVQLNGLEEGQGCGPLIHRINKGLGPFAPVYVTN